MPALPPTIPANLYTTLSAIRSSVFLSTHNPTGARIGTKYLRRTLRGPAALAYYPKPMLKPSTMDRIASSELRFKEQAYIAGGGDRFALEQWKSEGQVAPGYGVAPKIPQAVLHDGMFWSASEDRRLRFIERRKRIGKGTPKKGEGKRSQMGGKKK